MAKKIAQVDAQAMNSLYASEIAKAGIKLAADDKGNAPQAFADHADYLELLKSVMAEDKRSDGDANDPLVD